MHTKTARPDDRAVVIGAGFAGLSAACCLAQAGLSVTLVEKNDQIGGRARVWPEAGFLFDMGPSWYWMPDVFDAFFARFGRTTADYYDLVRLDPGYRVRFGPGDVVDVPADLAQLAATFERIEPGSGARLRRYLADAAVKYEVGMGDYVWRPSLSLREFVDRGLIASALRRPMLTPLSRRTSRTVSDTRLRQILEFPALFLGGTAHSIPAMYSLMSHADLVAGTWYPVGGMGRIVHALADLAESLGVRVCLGEDVLHIDVADGRATAVRTRGRTLAAEWVVAAADYHHVEQRLLDEPWRTYDEGYWSRRTMSPSALLFYLGVEKRLTGLLHHNLFFDADLEAHTREIYDRPAAWPKRPLFYVCCPSQTDATVAPPGCENLFVLVPVAPGLEDGDEVRERVYAEVMTRLETLTEQSIRGSVIVRRSYAHREFVADFHAYRGNAYGLANTVRQTAVFKPRIRSRRVRNLVFAGQLTVPGPGVPPALISGQIAAGLILGEDPRGVAADQSAEIRPRRTA